VAARTIDGPERNYLTIEQVAEQVGMSKSTVRRLIAAGRFPRAAKLTGGTSKWTWRQVVFWQLYIEMRPYLRKKNPESSAQSEVSPAPHPGVTDPSTAPRPRRTR
jgi:excisionase family DNA binding protein